ncbi:hypothetical protein [Haladaptatus litoreus]|nr:hypothetical protein [Haladaptatus litoreus]
MRDSRMLLLYLPGKIWTKSLLLPYGQSSARSLVAVAPRSR